ncbi:MAG: septum site-determining protein MinC [Fusobacteriaceae bacterium]
MEKGVVVKFRNNRLIFNFNPNKDLKELQKEFQQKIVEMNNFTKSTDLEIELSGRKFSEQEKNRLISVIKKNSTIKITYLYYNQEKAVEIIKEQEKIVVEKIVEKAVDFSMKEGVTKFHKGTLRSGNSIKFAGHLVIFGDVNPGAMIEATGNVVVIGKILGTIHAGMNGDSKAIIGGISLNPIQIRIGNKIATNPNQGVSANKKQEKNMGFEIAYLKNNEIVIDFLDKNIEF